MQQQEVGFTTSSPLSRLSSVENSVRVLTAFTDQDAELSIAELTRRLRMPKSTVHRLAATLANIHMLEQNPDNAKYRLGILVFELGALARRKMDFAAIAKPFLMKLREETDESVHLAILDHLNVITVNSLESKQSIRMSLTIGMRKPSHATAAGKMLLAFRPQETVAQLFATNPAKKTPNTITDPVVFARELAAIRSCGYAVSDMENELGVRSLAAPVRDQYGHVLAAVSIVGPAHRLSKKVLAGFSANVVQAGDDISSCLGYRLARPGRYRC